MKHAENNFHYLLPPLYINYFFLNPVDEIEKKNVIISLFRPNATGPNGIPTNVFKLLINDVSYQLTGLFNLYFSHGVSPLIPKTNEIIPTYKKESKVKCSNYRQISFFSNIDKIIERIV